MEMVRTTISVEKLFDLIKDMKLDCGYKPKEHKILCELEDRILKELVIMNGGI